MRIIRAGIGGLSLVIMVALGSPAPVEAGMMGKTALGINVGGSLVLQDVDTDLEANSGLIVGLSGSRGLSDNLVVGLGVEWEAHTLQDKTSDFDVADVSTISIMPYAQWHFGMSETVSPYVVLGLGYNINSISEGNDLKDACPPCSLTIDNTFAVKVGGGVDYAISDALALNGEVAWKLNSGSGEVDDGTTTDTFDTNLSAVAVSVGIKILL